MKACVLCDQTVGINSTDGDSKGLGVPYEEGKLLGSFNQQNNMAEFQNSVLGDWETAVSPNRGSSGIGSSACLRKAVPGPLSSQNGESIEIMSNYGHCILLI